MPEWKILNQDEVDPEDHHHRHLGKELEEIHYHHPRRQSLPAGQAPEEDGQEHKHKLRPLIQKETETQESD
jgi:hypothetical protein